MPIYEFYCPDNHTVYQFLARTLGYREKIPRCPVDPAFRMERRVSRFAFLQGAKEESNDPFDGIDDDKMEALMMEMEKDMAGMDENNPDPKQLGHFMRKMAGAMGDKVPAEMHEVIRRLEAGEDPSKLEDQFGDLGVSEDGSDDLFTQTIKRLKVGFRTPKRDGKLYEMRDYVD